MTADGVNRRRPLPASVAGRGRRLLVARTGRPMIGRPPLMSRSVTRRRLQFGLVLFASAAIAAPGIAQDSGGPRHSDSSMIAEESVERPSASDAIGLLREGNARFVEGVPHAPHTTLDRLKATAENGQLPFATILTCADSRIPVERIFDRGVGDVFVVRVAGNVANTNEVGTIEYGVAHLHTPLVIVMGHTSCGAVTAVVQNAELHGAIRQLVDNIRPAVDFVRKNRPELNEEELVSAAIEANIWQSIDDLISTSEPVRKHVGDGSVKIVGAMYDLATGRVRFMGEHPYQERIVASASRVEESLSETENHGNTEIEESPKPAPIPAEVVGPIPDDISEAEADAGDEKLSDELR